MQKKIWILNHYAGGMLFEKGGRHYSIAKYLRKMGYEPIIFCCNAKHNSQSQLFYNGNSLWSIHIASEIEVPFVFVKGRAYTGNGKQRIMNMIDFYRNVKKSAREYEKEHGKPDVIYASSVHPLTLIAGLQLAKHYRVKCISEVRDLWPESLVSYGIVSSNNPIVMLLRRMEKWIYKQSDAIIFTMEGAYDYIKNQGWEKVVSRAKVFYINNGVDLEVFNYNKEHFQIKDSDLENPTTFKVVYTGSIRKVNNLGLLIDSAKLVKNEKVKFLIWGDGDELHWLQQRVAEEKIDNVIFKGRVEKTFVPYIVSQADVNIAHNSNAKLFRYGISFNKIFDYFAAGKPILCNFESFYNPVNKTKAGICLKKFDAAHVADAISKLSEIEPAEYKEYCKNAVLASEEYCFNNLTEKFVSITKGLFQ